MESDTRKLKPYARRLLEEDMKGIVAQTIRELRQGKRKRHEQDNANLKFY